MIIDKDKMSMDQLIDYIDKAKKESFEKGRGHFEPSPKTLARFDKLEETMVNKDLFDAKFAPIHEKLDSLLTRVKETNGRVKTLELWKSFLIGAWAVISLITIPLCIYIFNDIQKQDEAIASALEDYFNNYEITTE